MHFAGKILHKPSLREVLGGGISVKQQDGSFSKLCIAKVIYHIESATQIEVNEMTCSVSNEKEKPFPEWQ